MTLINNSLCILCGSQKNDGILCVLLFGNLVSAPPNFLVTVASIVIKFAGYRYNRLKFMCTKFRTYNTTTDQDISQSLVFYFIVDTDTQCICSFHFST